MEGRAFRVSPFRETRKKTVVKVLPVNSLRTKPSLCARLGHERFVQGGLWLSMASRQITPLVEKAFGDDVGLHKRQGF